MAIDKIGRYEIKAELGRGGMGAVYHAYDPRFRRDVALKVLPRQFVHHPTFRARFEREAQVIASLEHAAIVPVHDFGEQDDQLYFVMRFMSGGSLAERLKGTPLSLAEATRIVAHLAPALDEAHAKGIIHRDLKPANILFDQNNNPYIADFGIAKLAEGSMELTGSAIIGTPAYMSPEQVHGDRVLDGRSDIYALGIILFQMLTARRPYQANTPAKLMMKHLLDPVPNVLTVKADLPSGCRTVIAKAMAKKPDARFPTAGALANALQNVVESRNAPSTRKTGLGLPLSSGILLLIICFLLATVAFLWTRSDRAEVEVAAMAETASALATPQQQLAAQADVPAVEHTPTASLPPNTATTTPIPPTATTSNAAPQESTSTPLSTFTPALIPTSTFTPSPTPTSTFTPSPTPTFTFTPSPIATSTPLPSATTIPSRTQSAKVTLLEPPNNAAVQTIPVRFSVQVSGKQESDVLQLRMWETRVDWQKNVTTQWRSVGGDIYQAEVEQLPEGFSVGKNYNWSVVLIAADGTVRYAQAPARQILWNQPTGYHRNIGLALLEPAANSPIKNSELELRVAVSGMQEGDVLQLWMGSNRSHLLPVQADWLPIAGSTEMVAKVTQAPQGYGQQYYWTVTLEDPGGAPLPVPDAIPFWWDE